MIEQIAAASGKGRHPHRRRQLATIPDTNRRTKDLDEQRACSSSAPASPAARKARATARPSCPAAIPEAWPHVKAIFQAIAAKVEDGTPCCDWVGEDGAGHYVKMVHNGIEYGDMQLICEAYQLLKDGLGPERRRAARGLRRVEQGRARQLPDRDHRATSSRKKDEDGKPLVDKILDTAGQKGTGKWTAHQRARSGHAAHADRRGGLRALPVGAEGRARRGLEGAERARSANVHRRSQGVHRRRAPRALLLEDHLLRAGLHAAARGREGVQAGS